MGSREDVCFTAGAIEPSRAKLLTPIKNLTHYHFFWRRNLNNWRAV